MTKSIILFFFAMAFVASCAHTSQTQARTCDAEKARKAVETFLHIHAGDCAQFPNLKAAIAAAGCTWGDLQIGDVELELGCPSAAAPSQVQAFPPRTCDTQRARELIKTFVEIEGAVCAKLSSLKRHLFFAGCELADMALSNDDFCCLGKSSTHIVEFELNGMTVSGLSMRLADRMIAAGMIRDGVKVTSAHCVDGRPQKKLSYILGRRR